MSSAVGWLRLVDSFRLGPNAATRTRKTRSTSRRARLQSTTSFGSVVLAAYSPDPALFARQLTSIRDQTHREFECVIVADGDPLGVSRLVEQILGADTRFRVVGFEDRVGFYRNFERGLRMIDPASTWVALSDQDDYWQPTKLEVLLPLLADHTLVSCQARLVSHPSGEVVAENTRRRTSSPEEIVIDNQFTGSFMVFRPDVLMTALPFPIVRSRAEVHDHWIAVCSAALGDAFILDEVLQDYMQHDRNVLGESRLRSQRFHPTRLLRALVAESRRYEGSAGVRSLVRYRYRQVLGWECAMVTMLANRAPDNEVADRLSEIFGRRRRWTKTIGFLSRATRSRRIPIGTTLLFLQGWVLERLATVPRRGEVPDDADRVRRANRAA